MRGPAPEQGSVRAMELKDVNKVVVLNQSTGDSKVGRQISGRALAAPSAGAVPTADRVDVTAPRRPAVPARTEVNSRANELINTANIAAEAAGEIEKLVKSIDGIVEQVSSKEIPDVRKSILETEANDLVAEIKRRAGTSAPGGVKPLAGDKIRLEVEEKLGKTLEFLLPADAKEAFGLGRIKFTTKDAILDTVASVQAARERVKELRGAVDSTLETIRSAVTELDVANQNSEAAESSLRDVDEALKLAGRMRQGISSNPASALGSFGNLDSRVLDLLD